MREPEEKAANFSILNTYIETGDSLDEYEETVALISERTEFVTVIPSELRFMSFDRAAGDTACFHRLSKIAIDNFEADGILTEDSDHPGSVRGRKASVRIETEMIPYIEECARNRLFVTYLDEHRVPHAAFVAPTAKAQFCQWIGLKGDAVLNANHLSVDLLIADLYRSVKKPLTLVVISEPGRQGRNTLYRKITGVLGPNYVSLPATIFPDIVRGLGSVTEGLGEPHVRYWRADHRLTELYVDFPQADLQSVYGLPSKVVPGIRLSNSDIGMSSMKAEPAYWMNDGMALSEPVRRRHSGNITAEAVSESIRTEVLAGLPDYPEALQKRIPVEIGNEDLTTAVGQGRNRRLVSRCLKIALAETGIMKLLGTKRSKAALEKLRDDISGKIRYTEFNIVEMVTGLASGIDGITSAERVELARCCGKAAFIHFYEKLLEAVPSYENIFLTEEED